MIQTFIGLTTDREKLYDKINKRVDIMLQNGYQKKQKKYMILK